jgi:hypothetical protein
VKEAEKTIDSYTVYVDSVNTVPVRMQKPTGNQLRRLMSWKQQAETALSDLKDDQEEKIEVSKLKYAALKGCFGIWDDAQITKQ